MTKGNKKLAKEILDLADRLMAMNLTLGIVERQFFFNFWCQEYLDGIKKLKLLLGEGKKSMEDVCHEALNDKGFYWLADEFTQAAEVITELSNRFGIAWQDIIQHITGTLPLTGYAKYEIYLADSDAMHSIAVPPGESVLIIYEPTLRDLKLLAKYLRREFLPRRRRKRYVLNHVRTCACLCLAERAHYGDRGAISQWKVHFPQKSYFKGKLLPRETKPGEIQFNREKHALLERFNKLEQCRIHFIGNGE